MLTQIVTEQQKSIQLLIKMFYRVGGFQKAQPLTNENTQKDGACSHTHTTNVVITYTAHSYENVQH